MISTLLKSSLYIKDDIMYIEGNQARAHTTKYKIKDDKVSLKMSFGFCFVIIMCVIIGISIITLGIWNYYDHIQRYNISNINSLIICGILGIISLLIAIAGPIYSKYIGNLTYRHILDKDKEWLEKLYTLDSSIINRIQS